MSWLSTLARTYDLNYGKESAIGGPKLSPLYHTTQNAHIVVVVDGKGGFLAARTIPKESTIIPCTESSAGRSGSKCSPHALFDKIEYVAGDYNQYLFHGGPLVAGKGETNQESESFTAYITQLRQWCASGLATEKVNAVLIYLEKRHLVADLLGVNVLSFDEKPDLKKVSFSANPLVLFECQTLGDPDSKLWNDEKVRVSWRKYLEKTMADANLALCYVTGIQALPASNHPKRIRNNGDGSKLISSNDKTEFTYRGRFFSASEACEIGTETTQKAHNALNWLIQKQGLLIDSTTIVSWAIAENAESISPVEDITAFYDPDWDNIDIGTAEGTAKALNQRILGYKSKNINIEGMVVMMLNASTPGTMAIKYYREFRPDDFFERITYWHTHCLWEQSIEKGRSFCGAPSPSTIASVMFGSRCDAKSKRRVVERILPCILGETPLPKDILEVCVRETVNTNRGNRFEFTRNLGVSCALYRYSNLERNYAMALEEDRKTRDYLYGRLLAVADYRELRALQFRGESRPSNAMKLMAKFFDRPFSTWRILELMLAPYRSYLQVRVPGLFVKLEKIQIDILSAFSANDFVLDTPLSAEALLGYYCQIARLYEKTSINYEGSDVESLPQN